MATQWGGNATRKARRAIRAMGQLQPCGRCGRLLDLDVDQWDAGHIIGRSEGGDNRPANLGPEHASCNREAGGRLGKARQMARNPKRIERRLRRW